ncbi:MAG TPA: Gfo/Idh/MocA family oxidoreductase [Cyclobacteriaceae bacterium]|jgi:predicted dehydrogenase|nr:Gfo/Idh/MocA family oxidoreductase [Cytophagales bacterium]HNT49384.1 Gfo/Idh/MocA family oxidoreductase [Cyclobacteriaceae bacterium]HRE65871.1 Gfo/Idh/MocA family oxidoreductase [Cyclobacteriaceae bacterium]HRF33715.1 Gfo/Idh/MocA family oxidoreductase [Cyclobacteriaceae bacterium]
MKSIQSRREFVKKTSLIAGSLAALPFVSKSQPVNTSVDDAIKIALIGCGGRGTGAAMQALLTKQNVKLVAMADAFRDRVDQCFNALTDADNEEGNVSDRVAVPEENKFVGFDGYKKAIALADVVILTTPPGFRPIHFEEAVRLGKHVFMEKPVATDPAGIKRVLDAAIIARQKKLNVVVGLQRHYQNSYRELYKKYKEGVIGDIVSAQAWWNNEGVWVNPRKYNQTEMEYQMRNWYYFNWLCGDHIVEQHIHNIDVINWFKGGYPVRAQGMGGREVRKGKEFGEIFDHHYVEFTYADGTVLNSQCRHIKGTMSKVDELIMGTKGNIYFGAANMVDRKGKVLYQYDRTKENNPYQTEHDELFAAIAKKEYKFDDTDNGARSTMTSILGRMATYSGKVVEFDKALNSGLSIMPTQFDFNALPSIVPNADGLYPVAVPGVTNYNV